MTEPSNELENPFKATPNWQKYQAFEWLRNIALGDTEVARIAAVALVEWSNALRSEIAATEQAPVAWRYRHRAEGTFPAGDWRYVEDQNDMNRSSAYEREPLYPMKWAEPAARCVAVPLEATHAMHHAIMTDPADFQGLTWARFQILYRALLRGVERPERSTTAELQQSRLEK